MGHLACEYADSTVVFILTDQHNASRLALLARREATSWLKSYLTFGGLGFFCIDDIVPLNTNEIICHPLYAAVSALCCITNDLNSLTLHQ